jgi:hypothetical protein
MSILIRYEGFIVVATDRFYNFSVSGASEEPRQFIVGISSRSFVKAQLKFQDGPAICFHRLKVEIDRESLDCPANAQMTISGQDIEDYLVTQHPRKVLKKKRAASGAAAEDSGAISSATMP